MHPIVRVILGVVTGVIASFVIVAGVEAVCFVAFPLPPGTSIHDPAAMRAAMANVPVGAKVMVMVGWFFGALAGTFLAAKIAHSAGLGVIVGASLLTMAVLNMLAFPHPLWMWVGAIVFYLVATWLGVRLGAPKGASATPSAPAAPTPA